MICCACAPPVGNEPAPHPFEGGQLAHGYGVTLQRVTYVPNDRTQSFGLVEACESADGSSCGPHSWAPDEVESIEQATAQLGAISGFTARARRRSARQRLPRRLGHLLVRLHRLRGARRRAAG
jgi:hypothetical protein